MVALLAAVPGTLLLIIGEATQQALLGEDFSFTNAMLVIATLIVLDVGLSLAKLNSRRLARLVDGHATLVVDQGRFLHHRMRRADQVRHRRAQRQDLDHPAGVPLPAGCKAAAARYVDHPL